MGVNIIRGVPYYSQFSRNISPDIQARSCTFACLKMCADLWLKGFPRVDDLCAEIEAIQQDMEERGTLTREAIRVGPSHAAIVTVAHNHGLVAYPEEFRAMTVVLNGALSGARFYSTNQFTDDFFNYGVKKIYREVEKGNPVIVSVLRNFRERKTHHSVLIVGSNSDRGNRGFYCHDPDCPDGVENLKKGVFVSIEDFRRAWWRRAIFLDRL